MINDAIHAQQVGEKYKIKCNFLFQTNSKCIHNKFNVLNTVLDPSGLSIETKYFVNDLFWSIILEFYTYTHKHTQGMR